jgi:predicted transcriptional regulator
MGWWQKTMMENSLELQSGSLLGWGSRGWLEIVNLMLMVCERGAIKTHVMYKCNLNSKQLQQYMEFMLRRDLVSKVEETGVVNRTVYVTTERGMKLREAYEELAGIFAIKDAGLQK